MKIILSLETSTGFKGWYIFSKGKLRDESECLL